MKLLPTTLLSRLGSGESITTLCRAAGINRDEFDAWWKNETVSRVPKQSGIIKAPTSGTATIDRDEWGIPHINAESDIDLFIAFGYAMAQDRLFQMDWLRRKATGCLSEITGADGLEQDTISRIIGHHRIAETELEQSPDETRQLLEAFTKGVNVAIEQSESRMPIEFDLLGYHPAPWKPVDCLSIASELRYYLTVRYPVITNPELALRTLGDGQLYQEFLKGEADDESIVPTGEYPLSPSDGQPVGATVSDNSDGAGSNNWVVSGSRTASGRPMVASDPHIAFAAVSCWYEAHLTGASFNVVGMAYAGMPAVMFGRTAGIAWGITNNICSQRDLYQEKTDTEHPDSFLFDGQWEPATKVEEVIQVKGKKPAHIVVTSSRNGPIVNDILPRVAQSSGPVSLRWLGTEYCGWLTSLLGMDRAQSAEEFTTSMDGWLVPTFSVVFAEENGNIGYQSAGQIPLRRSEERGYRPGWDPDHQWTGLIPRDGMPGFQNPDRGWITSANNRAAPENFPHPLYGRWSSGHRARRIRQMLEARETLTQQDMVDMQHDVTSIRATECVPKLIDTLAKTATPRISEALSYLSSWDYLMDTDRVGATIFDVFFTHWQKTVVKEHFHNEETASAIAGSSSGLASTLLAGDEAGWFCNSNRVEAIKTAMNDALAELEERLGSNMALWNWGRLHKINLQHVLSDRGDLGQLLDRGGLPVKGNGITVCNTGYDPNYLAPMGANYRLITDFSVEPAGLFAVDAQGISGHPGSTHYCDQLDEWMNARYHFLPLDQSEAKRISKEQLVLQPPS